MKIHVLIEMDFGRENFVDQDTNFQNLFDRVISIIKKHYKKETFVVEKEKIGFSYFTYIFSEEGRSRFSFIIISKEVEESINEFNFDEIEGGIHNVL